MNQVNFHNGYHDDSTINIGLVLFRAGTDYNFVSQ